VRTMPSEQEESARNEFFGALAGAAAASSYHHLQCQWLRRSLLSDRILLLIACRPRARVILVRACAVGIARPPGAKMAARALAVGRLGAPCKAGGHRCSLLLVVHGCRCHRAPQFRAIGSPVGRAALRLETGRATWAVRKPRRMQARPGTIWTRMGRTSRPGRSDGVNL
jgi:hypothetical protein